MIRICQIPFQTIPSGSLGDFCLVNLDFHLAAQLQELVISAVVKMLLGQPA